MSSYWRYLSIIPQVWVRLGDMEEGVHQLRQGIAQGVLTSHAVHGLLNATIDALATATVSDNAQEGGARKALAWGWRVRPAVEEAEEDEDEAVGDGSASGTAEGKEAAGGRRRLAASTGQPAVSEEQRQRGVALDRAWKYFTAAKRAARSGGGEPLLGPAQYKLMVRAEVQWSCLCFVCDFDRRFGLSFGGICQVPLCRTAGGLRELVEDYTVHCQEAGAGSRGEDEAFAKVAHAAWMELGDPAAAVDALQQLLLWLPPEPDPEEAGADSAGHSPDSADAPRPQAGAAASVRDRVGRYHSSTLLKLLQPADAGSAATAGRRSDALNYLQILRRHELADIYHYTIVLQSCGKMSDVEMLLGWMDEDGVRQTAATKRTLAVLHRTL